MTSTIYKTSLCLVTMAMVLVGAAGLALAQDPPRTIQPGAPGEPGRVLDSGDITQQVHPEYSQADVDFMQGMIQHHAQAIEMTALVPDRAASDDVRMLARRIEASQDAEIALMQRWLSERGEDATAADAHAGHHQHNHDLMPGMLTHRQLMDLAEATGEEFDRLFLELMIFHHEGALIMVEELFNHDGAAQDSTIFRFASHVDSDQRVEIDRMRALLNSFPQPDRE